MIQFWYGSWYMQPKYWVLGNKQLVTLEWNYLSLAQTLFQPRRIVAMSIAERVAWERGEVLGKSVGYQVSADTHVWCWSSKEPRSNNLTKHGVESSKDH